MRLKTMTENKNNEVVTGWNEIWDKYQAPNYLGRRLHQQRIKTLTKILKSIKLPLDAGIVDVGCGSGSTLSIFRGLGYGGAIGVDGAENSLIISRKLYGFVKDKDVFMADARQLPFKDNSHDLVFSQGLLEHYEQKSEALQIVKELCRLSKKYVLLLQPDQSSLFGLAKRLYESAGRSSWEKEYNYSKKDYIELFDGSGFKFLRSGSSNLHEELWLLFSRNGD
jgi:ubiquinone/menaquinone biosynthesis C-methylase UbiE